VASNQELRKRLYILAEKLEINPLFPPPRLCTDNGVMVAWAGMEHLLCNFVDDPQEVEINSRWYFTTEMVDFKDTTSKKRSRLNFTLSEAERTC